MRSPLPLLLLLGCRNPEGYAPAECTDALDNDGDGLYDCDDPDCADAPACAEGDADTDADTDTDSDTDTGGFPCGVGIVETTPVDGAADAYHRAAIEFRLTDPDPGSPGIEVTGPEGLVPGSTFLADDGEVVVFAPTDPLEPETAYRAALDFCSGIAAIEFTTSALGQPCGADLSGRAYVVNWLSGRFLEPAGLTDLLGEYVQDGVLAVQAESAVDLAVLGGMLVEGTEPPEQDRCVPTVESAWAWDEAPYFTFGPADVTLVAAEGPLTVMDLWLEGTFAPEGTWFGGGELAFTLDARELVDFIAEVDEPADLCALMASFGAPCEACLSDGEPLCLPFSADQLEGVESAGTAVEPVPASGHPDCEGDPGCGCAHDRRRGAGAALPLLALAGIVWRRCAPQPRRRP
jgi:hypothetical protein